jgi:hypothetical protein
VRRIKRALELPILMTLYPQKITFGELRESGVRDVLIYCRDRRDHRCSLITLRSG